MRGKTILLNGPTTGLTSFALVNRRLCEGLTRAGFDVWRGDDPDLPRQNSIPDICLTHGHPYDATTAPARVNLFFLEYEYARFAPSEATLAARLNARFDACVVPSEFVRRACEESGVEIPLVRCPLGVDPEEFHPQAIPASLPTEKGFKFVYVGGATDRKGADVLVRAYRAEFDAHEDVALVLKTQGYDHLLPWFEGVLAEAEVGPGAEIVHEHGSRESIAGYFTAADVGVFPFRGEAFGLPILECVASGRPVIATSGGGPDDYLTSANATLVGAAPRASAAGQIQLEPDVDELRRCMRHAFESRAQPVGRGRLRDTVASFSWAHTVNRLVEILEDVRPIVRAGSGSARDSIVHAYGETGSTSWKSVAAHMDSGLQECGAVVSYGASDPVPPRGFDVLLAHSGFALEHQTRLRDDMEPGLRLLVRGNGPWADVLAITNRERHRLDVEPVAPAPGAAWRHAREESLADVIVVHSRASKRRYQARGWAPENLAVVPLGFVATRPRTRSRSSPLRFLFLGTSPYRKGIRVLLEAWHAARPRGAELLCLANTDVLESRTVLRLLVRNPNVTVEPLVPFEHLDAVYSEVDCQILPSFEDGFSLSIAEGMGHGVPAIVSDETGIVDLLEHGRDARIVPTGSVEALAAEITRACEGPAALASLGNEAFETARRRPWSRFEEEIASLATSLRRERSR